LNNLFHKNPASFKKLCLLVFVSGLLLAISACLAQQKDSGDVKQLRAYEFVYKNPNPQVEMRDTDILPDNGRFYAVGTCPPYWEGPNPGVKLYVSNNLIDWKFEKLLIDANTLPESNWYIDRFWAPELAKIKGKYYLTFNSENNRKGYEHFHACALAVSEKIDGPYKVLTADKPLTPWPSNDISLFEDEDGKVYAFFNNGWTAIHKIFVAQVDLVNGRLMEEPVELIAQEPGKWDGGGIEGSQVVKHDGTYYLFYSSWTRGYAVGYAASKNIRGPYKKYEKNPLFGAWTEGDKNVIVREGKSAVDPNSPYTAVGHNQFFTGPDGRTWTSCPAYTRGGGKAWLLIDPIWFENGVAKTNAPTYTTQKVTISAEMNKLFPGLKTSGK